MTRHNALIVWLDADSEWEVWCRGCGWSRTTRSMPLARHLQREHNNPTEGDDDDR